jgi:hypothetical protein
MTWYTAQRYPMKSGFLDTVTRSLDECYAHASDPSQQGEQFDQLHHDLQASYRSHCKTVTTS